MILEDKHVNKNKVMRLFYVQENIDFISETFFKLNIFVKFKFQNNI